MGMTLDEVSLLCLFLETLLYGAFFTLYWLTLFILLKRNVIQRQLLIPVVTVLLCNATAHLIINFVQALEAFIFQAHTVGADAYYSNLSSPLELAKMAFYITQTILADSVILWRCYVLYNKSLSIAIPGCVVLLTNGAIGCYVVWTLSGIHSGSLGSATWWISSFYTLTMTISNTCTILIAWRIYRTRRFLPGGIARLLPIFIVIVESGALYTLSILVLLVTLLNGSNRQYVVPYAVVPIVGIAFCLIILQVHFHVGDKHPIEQSIDPRGIVFRGQDARDGSYGMEPVIVHITEETEVVLSDVMDRSKDQLFLGNGFQS
ncbi:hypothetical protein M405DRAFT_850039 [Rhizopogon salebrosus TDB-379]|nr:hypothetical protein M405DRAFT_850039 [Rhizopogon salebrosus TDB-379]